MDNNELAYYDKIKNWDFSMIKYEEENLHSNIMYYDDFIPSRMFKISKNK